MRILNKLFFAITLSLVSFAALAQNVTFNVKVSPAHEGEGMMLFVSSLSIGEDNSAQEAKSVDGKFVVTVKRSSTGFYNVVTVKNNVQTITPVYFGDDDDEIKFTVKCTAAGVSVENGRDNKALSAYNSVLAGNGMKLWDGNVKDCDMLKQLVLSYEAKADSIAKKYRCSADVRKYLEISAYTAAQNAYSIAPRAMRIKASEITFAERDLLADPSEVLDDDLAVLFYPAVHIITSSVPRGSLCERLEYVDSRYSSAPLKEKLFETLVSGFVTSHDTDNYFDDGMAQLNEAISKYGVDASFRALYGKRRNTMVGNAFPADVVLEDAAGNRVDFASFKGKYVYIDLWASWCGPCVREVPHLKKLESELQNSEVVFVSISVDTNKEAWLKKVDALDLHGHQLIDANGKLGEALNVQGVPHFLIYDKEGNLYIYKAMRPSTGEPLKELLESLK